MKIKLITVPEPAEGTASVLQSTGTDQDTVFFQGSGGVDLVCANCGHTLARGLDAVDSISGVVFLCPSCGEYQATERGVQPSAAVQ